MNKKKVGFITAGVATALVAASPLAFAGDSGHDKHGHGHGHGHDKQDSRQCEFEGGNGGAGSLIAGGALANVVAQVPVAGNNIANIGNCSDFLNNNLNDNVSGNAIGVLNGAPVVAAPGR